MIRLILSFLVLFVCVPMFVPKAQGAEAVPGDVGTDGTTGDLRNPERFKEVVQVLENLPSLVFLRDLDGKLSRSDVPLLVDLIHSKEHAPLWKTAIKVMPLIDEPNHAFAVMKEHLTTFIDYKEVIESLRASQRYQGVGFLALQDVAEDAISDILDTVYMMYNLPGAIAGPFLLQSVDADGAVTILSNWTRGSPTPMTSSDMRFAFRYSAANALVLIGDRKYNSLLDKYFARLKKSAKPHSDDNRFVDTYSEIFALADFAKDVGRDEAIKRLSCETDPRFHILAKYIPKHYKKHPL